MATAVSASQQLSISKQSQKSINQPSYDDLLESVGSRRLYQFLFLTLTALAVAFPAMQMMSFNFTLLRGNYECAAVGNNATTAADAAFYNMSECSNECVRWRFDDRFMNDTVLESFDLVCNWDSAAAVVKAMFMLGFLLGSTGYGMLSDRWGRRKSFMLASVSLSITGVVASFATEIVGYCVLRTMVGFSAAGVLTVCYTWHTEMLHSSDRFMLSLVMKNGWSIGIFAVTGLAHLTRDWRLLELAMAGPSLLLLLYYFVLAESPRWLLSLSKTDEAAAALQQMARINGSEQRLQSLLQQRGNTQMHCTRRQSQAFAPLHSLLRLRALRAVTLIVWANFCITSIGYYGISLNWNSLGGNAFTTMLLGGCVEIAARIMGMLLGCCCGRTHLLLLSLAIGGISLLSLTAQQSAHMMLGLGGRFGMLLAFEIMWLYANEIFPTVVRNSAVGFGSTAARVGGVIAPQLSLLAKFWQPAPLLIFGSLSLIGSCFTLLLPETKGRQCADSLEEADQQCSSDRMIDSCCSYCCRCSGCSSNADNADAVAMRRHRCGSDDESLQPMSETERHEDDIDGDVSDPMSGSDGEATADNNGTVV